MPNTSIKLKYIQMEYVYRFWIINIRRYLKILNESLVLLVYIL